jgi:lipid-A-disaccharide synthase
MITYPVSKSVMISAGEASGELYGALLCRELRRRWPEIEIFGIGGPRMRAEGVSIIAPITHVLGLAEVLRHLLEIRRTLKKAADALLSKRPSLLVLIDYPDFNLALAARAKAAGIPVLYYVSPQVWAWRRGRVKKIAARADRMAVLFPFEVDCYRGSALPCEFVGHPVTELMPHDRAIEDMKRQLALDESKRTVALLPGSRPNEIWRHQEIVRDVAEMLQSSMPDVQTVVPLTGGTNLTIRMPGSVKTVRDVTPEALACSDAAAVASGTATLQTALAGTPMVVYYRISPITFFLGRMLTQLEFISIVNILAGRKIVAELLQKDASAENIFNEIRRLLDDGQYRESMIRDLDVIRGMMAGKRPSSRVATIIGEMVGWSDATV